MKREKKKSPAASAWDEPEDFVAENFAAARAGVDRSLKDVAAYAQLHPEKALLWAVGGGYLLRMLPVVGILGALIRLVMMLVKPAALLYGVSKAWQKTGPMVAPRHTPEIS